MLCASWGSGMQESPHGTDSATCVRVYVVWDGVSLWETHTLMFLESQVNDVPKKSGMSSSEGLGQAGRQATQEFRR